MVNVGPDNRVGQVQVVPFRNGPGYHGFEVLVLKRNEEKGGFWQPVTGGIEPEEAVEAAAYRELNEELGATPDDCERMVNDGYEFVFTDMHRGLRKTFTEHVVAVIFRQEFEPRLSAEHVDLCWTSPDQAIKMLKYESNKASVRHYADLIDGEDHDRQAGG